MSATDPQPSGTSTARLAARGVHLGYGRRAVVHDLTLAVPDGEATVIIGPNGCGKSTLLRAFGRLLGPQAGTVLLDGKRIDRLPTRDVARQVGLLPQTPSAPPGLTVADLVARGRHPHRTWLRQWSTADETAVTAALACTGMTDLADRDVDEFSGGQRQGPGCRWRWPRKPMCCCSTNPPRTWTSPTPSRCSISSTSSTPTTAAPSSWSCTT